MERIEAGETPKPDQQVRDSQPQAGHGRKSGHGWDQRLAGSPGWLLRWPSAGRGQQNAQPQHGRASGIPAFGPSPPENRGSRWELARGPVWEEFSAKARIVGTCLALV